MPDIFASAKRSLSRGQHHIGDLAERLNAIVRANAYATFVVEPNPDGATEVLKVRFHPLFRDEFPSIVFDAVSNFRACLDQICYAIAVPRGLPEGKYSRFPIANDIKWLADQLNGLKYLPPEIRTLFRSFNPYKGGNDALWALNELCNVKKHAALVPIDVRHLSIAMRPPMTPISGPMHMAEIRGPITMGGATFDAEANEIALATYPRGTNAGANTQVSFAVVLDHPEKAVSGQHPIFLLEAIRKEVERVMADTEAECRRIGIIT